jgi:hypothetical protein
MVTYAGIDLHSEKFWGRSQDLKFRGYPGQQLNDPTLTPAAHLTA